MSAMKIRIKLDRDRVRSQMTVEDMIAIEESTIKGGRAMLATFMVDENEQYIPREQAELMVNKLSIGELEELIPTLRDEIQKAMGVDPKAEKESSPSTDTGTGETAPTG